MIFTLRMDEKLNIPTVESTIELVKEAYGKGMDRSGNYNYLHPIAVMDRLPSKVDGKVGDKVKMAALLHDVIEDHLMTREQLEERGYDRETLAMVQLLTHVKDKKGYFPYVKAITGEGLTPRDSNAPYNVASLEWANNPSQVTSAELRGYSRKEIEGIVLIKYADMKHNTSPERTNSLEEKHRNRLENKYKWPLKILESAVKALGYEINDSPQQSRSR